MNNVFEIITLLFLAKVRNKACLPQLLSAAERLSITQTCRVALYLPEYVLILSQLRSYKASKQNRW